MPQKRAAHPEDEMSLPPAGGVAAEKQRWNKAEGDLAAIASLHDRYLQAVFSYVSRRVPDRTEAEDITAEVFAAALGALPKFRGEGGHYAWLLGIARRKIADSARRLRCRRELLDTDLNDEERRAVSLLLATDVGQLPEEALQHTEARQVMRKLLAALPEMQREVLLLQVVDDLSIREIARVIGRSEAAANSLLQRARAALYRHGRGYFVE
jgi:RNA polymerase sigma-70 factor, ECF subfamily